MGHGGTARAERSLEPRSQVRTGPGQWPPVHAAWPAGTAI